MAAPEGTDRRGLSRRNMIKASAVAGAAAWTAPVIIDSLASPAAAATGPPCGCTRLNFNSSCQPDNSCSDTKCLPTFPAPCPALPSCNAGLVNCFTVACNTPNSGDITITYICSHACSPVTPSAEATGNTCVAPDINGGTFGPWTFSASLNVIQTRVGLVCPPCPT
jgi:hypothetical protein